MPPVALVALIVLVGTGVSLAYHYVLAAYVGLKYPWNTFLLAPKDHFSDYFNVYRHAQGFRPGVAGNMVYSPLLHLVMTVLNVVPAWVGFMVVTLAFVATLSALMWKWTLRLVANPLVRIQYVVVLGALAYPVLFLLDRGNLEMVVFVMLAAFFYLYYWRRSPYAWVALSLAVAAKYYWITLVMLLLLDRRFRQAVACVVGAVAVTVASALVIGVVSGYGVDDVLHSLTATLAGHVDNTGALGFATHAHTLWACVIWLVHWSNMTVSVSGLQRLYLLGTVGIMLLVVLRLLRGHYADWQKATALVACTLVLPFESADYTLVHLLLPLCLFAATWRQGWKAWASAALFGLLLVPLDYYYFMYGSRRSNVGVSMFAYAALLLALIVIVFWGGLDGVEPAKVVPVEGPAEPEAGP